MSNGTTSEPAQEDYSLAVVIKAVCAWCSRVLRGGAEEKVCKVHEVALTLSRVRRSGRNPTEDLRLSGAFFNYPVCCSRLVLCAARILSMSASLPREGRGFCDLRTGGGILRIAASDWMCWRARCWHMASGLLQIRRCSYLSSRSHPRSLNFSARCRAADKGWSG
jgi:hypothetical protein